jgi:hypothetical protein
MRPTGGRGPDRLGVGRMPKMHGDELEIDEPLVRRLLADEFPEWASLPVGLQNSVPRLIDTGR